MPLNVTVDLRPRFGAIRDQADRPTCLAFATSDAHAALRDPWVPLSCEYIFYHAQRRGNRPPTSGAVPNLMLAALKEDGQPIESSWPYLLALPADLSAYAPPPTATVFRRDGGMLASGIAAIIAHLDAHQPVLVLMKLSNSFDLAGPDGIVRAPPDEAPDPTRRHAVIAVGHGTIGGAPAILVRNSWGEGWGAGGHGWLPEAYLAPRLTGVALLTDELNVSA